MKTRVDPEIELKIDRLMESGDFASREEIVEKALRLLELHEKKLARLRAELAIADEQLARGEFVEYTPDFMKQRMANAKERSRLGLPIKNAVKPWNGPGK